MERFLILGASGRLGQETSKAVVKAFPGVEVVAASRRKVSEEGALRWAFVDVGDYNALATLVSSVDLVIDCCGPSALWGESISRACGAVRVPLVSAGHRYDPPFKGHAQIHRAGALPGILAAAPTLAPSSAFAVEVVYSFKGALSPSAAHDILDEAQAQAQARAKVQAKAQAQAQDAELSQRFPVLLSGRMPQECVTPFFDDDIEYLSRLLSTSQPNCRNEVLPTSVKAFTVWANRSVRETLSTAMMLSAHEGAALLSARAAVGSVPDSVQVDVAWETVEGKGATQIFVPSLARLSAEALVFAAQELQEDRRKNCCSFVQLCDEKPSEVLNLVVRRAGGCFVPQTQDYDEGVF